MSLTPKILYIDDEADLLDLAASFFEEENLPIHTCTNFHEALDLVRKNDYDLIISDAKMPSGSGFELFGIVKSEGYFKGKFILVTGNVESSDMVDANKFDLVLYKPIRFEELVQTVKKLLSIQS